MAGTLAYIDSWPSYPTPKNLTRLKSMKADSPFACKDDILWETKPKSWLWYGDDNLLSPTECHIYGGADINYYAQGYAMAHMNIGYGLGAIGVIWHKMIMWQRFPPPGAPLWYWWNLGYNRHESQEDNSWTNRPD